MQLLLNLGADVDSRFIWVACAAHSFRAFRIDNERKAILQWLRSVPRGSRLAMESTGGYHELLAALAQKAGLQVFVINPRDLRRYAEGVGRRAKTDRVDAQLIARYISREHEQLHAYVAPSKAQREFAKLMRGRAKVVEVKGTLGQSLRGLSAIKSKLRQLQDKCDELIDELECLMDEALDQTPCARETAKRIEAIPGLGQLSSNCFVHHVTRLPYSNSDALVASIGFDPRPADSGQKRGRRRLSKRGPSEQRRLFFNCARSAARTAVWRPYYELQVRKGLSATAATVVLARKMLRVAFAVYKSGQPFKPELLYGNA